jgi:hypothetical protein
LKAKEAAGPHDLFHLPISLVAYQQLLQLVHSLDSIPESQELDFWSYIWGTPLYSSAKAYKHLTGHRGTHPAFKWLWTSNCQNKHKVFFWLLLVDRLSTRDILQRCNMALPSYNCVCCQNGILETLVQFICS